MRPQKQSDKEILVGLTDVFRAKGYEGASLKDLSEASGLKKASLYHRFPNGKEEMANAVLHHLDMWVKENVFQGLLDDSLPPAVRLKKGLSGIRTLYDNGNQSCIFRALSMHAGLELFEEQVKNGMKAWISVFKKVGVSLQLLPDEAQKNALETLIKIQGSIVFTRGLGDISIFENTLISIEKNYLNE